MAECGGVARRREHSGLVNRTLWIGKLREPLEVDSQRIYLRTQTLKSDTPIWQIRHFSFLGIETMESSNQISNEFDSNLDLLKIAYKV
jgi:hypothetical protein